MKDYNGPKGPHPEYGHALGGAPFTVGGITFRPYRRGILRYIRVSDDFRIEVYAVDGRSTYRAGVDGVCMPKKFRFEKNAYAAAIAQTNRRAE